MRNVRIYLALGFIATLSLAGSTLQGQLQHSLLQADLPRTSQESPTQAEIDGAREALRAKAAELPFFLVANVLYDRECDVGYVRRWFPDADEAAVEEHNEVIRAVTNGTYSRAVLLELLKDSDAEVRVLGSVALFDLEDPSVLPAIAALFSDENEVFHPRDGRGRPWQVGSIASALTTFYTKLCGIHRGSLKPGFPDFEKYWELRKSRTFCASWFNVQLARASRGSTRSTESGVAQIQALRTRIDQLPPLDRAWTLLYLRYEVGSNMLATQQDLVEACKAVGRNPLLQVLDGDIPSEDPDLHHRYERIANFVLQNATTLLNAEDSAKVLAAEREQAIRRPNMRSPWWAVAAAHLDPESAPRILRAALTRFSDDGDSQSRAELYVALCELGDESDSEFIADRLFEENWANVLPSCRSKFFESVGGDPKGKFILRRMIPDERLSRLPTNEHKDLIRVVNAWFKKPVVTEEELRELHHPDEWLHAKNKAQASERHPRETARLEAQLAGLRKRLIEATGRLDNTQSH